eukprot:TRINITY_DN7638_c0_g1_i8.p1 TRINITY_DN7638_c0_g1~~TRINITY_DN7638_c0_g1_i8.p1  ORF type:complete len:770 (+),score=163.45 TRINITY_DN7638_c0_g1_i8:631-2940(+)
MVQTCFKMSIQKHLSVLLRKAAEMTLIEMIQCIFSSFNGSVDFNQTNDSLLAGISVPTSTPSQPRCDRLSRTNSFDETPGTVGDNVVSLRLPSLDAIESDVHKESNTFENVTDPLLQADHQYETQLELQSDHQLETTQQLEEETGEMVEACGKTNPHEKVKERKREHEEEKRVHTGSGTTCSRPSNDVEENLQPFSTLGLNRLLIFFAGLLHDNRKTDSVKYLGLTVINTVLEIQRRRLIDNTRLYDFVKDDLLKTLLQAFCELKLDNSVLSLLLRVLFNIFVTFMHDLKFQLSTFLIYCMKHLNDTEKVSLEQKEMILRNILQYLKEPSFALNLFLNYDCDINADDFFGDLIDFFYKNACYSGHVLNMEESSIVNMSLEGFSIILQLFCNRLKLPCGPPIPEFDVEKLKQGRQLKTILQVASEYFKEKPQLAFEYLQEKKLLPSPLDHKSIALFLKNTPSLSKIAIGEFLGKPSSEEILAEYVKLFDLGGGRRFILCVRDYFESFRPVGESQIIERYIEVFVKHFLTVNETLAGSSVDDIFTLIYSIIMLNVDLHSPNLVDRPKMTFQQYAKNLEGVNGGKDFDTEFLQDIYRTVVDDEIKIHSEHLRVSLTDNTWSHLFREAKNTNQVGVILADGALQHYDPLVFNAMWWKLDAALKNLFPMTKSQESLEKNLDCFQMSALVSSYYNLTQAFDHLISTLCDLSAITGTPIKRFGTLYGKNDRAHYATVTLFSIARKYGSHIRESWKNVFFFFRGSYLLYLPLPPFYR